MSTMEPEEEKPAHVRRERYQGTHPKSFKEKYKELSPEKYAADIEKVIAQGRTPAGMHRSICVDEIMEFLAIQPGETGMDATLGYGGHSLEILKHLQPGGRLFATDVDALELPRTQARLQGFGYGPETLFVRKMNFAGIDKIVDEAGLLNFVLADLGVSSMQIDNPDRGFSIKVEGPLDLRLNPTSGKPASEWLKTTNQAKLEKILFENSDEPYAAQIAEAIMAKVSRGVAISTTSHLKKIIHDVLSVAPLRKDKEEIKKACQRCFQALRIELNNEFGVLSQFLDALPYALAPGGRVAILTFHSGEDRRVKKSFQRYLAEGLYSEIAPEPMRASPAECASNPRAKSAKLRWAIRTA